MSSIKRFVCREPDFIVWRGDRPYLRRWYLIPKNRILNIYLHHFMQSDEDRALHDHPWPSIGVILSGKYREHLLKGKSRMLTRFIPVFRKAEHMHRIELTDGPVWTLFITGPRIRDWGFNCPQGWRHWKEFVQETKDGNSVGKGCD